MAVVKTQEKVYEHSTMALASKDQALPEVFLRWDEFGRSRKRSYAINRQGDLYRWYPKKQNWVLRKKRCFSPRRDPHADIPPGMEIGISYVRSNAATGEQICLRQRRGRWEAYVRSKDQVWGIAESFCFRTAVYPNKQQIKRHPHAN